MTDRVLVYGVAIAGESVMRALLRHGHEVVAADDTPTSSAISACADLAVELHIAPQADELDALRVEMSAALGL